MNHSSTAFKAREQLKGFFGELSPQFSKPLGKFVGDMVYGIQASQDVKLSQIARALDEPISMKKLEDRLSRMLGSEGIEQKIYGVISRLGSRHIRQDTLIVLDPTDIRKLYAEKMEYLARVRDGSTGEIGNGYSACLAVACESGGRRITPLHMRLRSSEADGFTSQNDELLGVVGLISSHAKKRGIYFNCVWLAGRLRCEILTANITHAAKRIYGVAEFLYYAVADGIGRLFMRHGKWNRYTPPDPESNPLGLVFLE